MMIDMKQTAEVLEQCRKLKTKYREDLILLRNTPPATADVIVDIAFNVVGSIDEKLVQAANSMVGHTEMDRVAMIFLAGKLLAELGDGVMDKITLLTGGMAETDDQRMTNLVIDQELALHGVRLQPDEGACLQMTTPGCDCESCARATKLSELARDPTSGVKAYTTQMAPNAAIYVMPNELAVKLKAQVEGAAVH